MTAGRRPDVSAAGTGQGADASGERARRLRRRSPGRGVEHNGRDEWTPDDQWTTDGNGQACATIDRPVRLLAAGVGVTTLLAGAEAPAGAAEIGPCDATGTIGTTAYALRRIHRREVITVPKSASIRWEGSVVGRPGGG